MNYCLLGATNEELGRVFGVDERTINRWLVTKPEFCQAVKNGRAVADAQVARALYLKATGQWTQPAVKILPDGTMIHYTEHFPPDTAAAYIWLKNRQPHRWRERKEVDVNTNSTETPTLRLELSPRALAHVEELHRILFREDDEPLELAAPSTTGNGV